MFVSPIARWLRVITSFNPACNSFLKLVTDFLRLWCIRSFDDVKKRLLAFRKNSDTLGYQPVLSRQERSVVASFLPLKDGLAEGSGCMSGDGAGFRFLLSFLKTKILKSVKINVL